MQPEHARFLRCDVDLDGVTYVAVGLERASAVGLVSLADPTKPRVTGVFPLGEGSISPEGLALVEREGRLFLLSANEISGDVTVFEVVR